MPKDNRTRNFCLTWNNYDEQFATKLYTFAENCKYMVYQCEVAPTTLTPHVQGYFVTKDKYSIRSVQSKLQEVGILATVIVANGSHESNYAYCTKEGGTNRCEIGVIPSKGNNTLVHLARKVSKNEICVAEIARSDPNIFVKNYKGLLALEAVCRPMRDHNVPPTVCWYFGPTGTGKSRDAITKYPEAYWKMGSNTWWDHYKGEKCVIIDDYRSSMCPFPYLLRLLDRYPLLVEAKGYSMKIAPEVIIITCPHRPEVEWKYKTEEDILQLLRRITEIWEYSPTSGPRLLKSGDIVYEPCYVDKSELTPFVSGTRYV